MTSGGHSGFKTSDNLLLDGFTNLMILSVLYKGQVLVGSFIFAVFFCFLDCKQGIYGN